MITNVLNNSQSYLSFQYVQQQVQHKIQIMRMIAIAQLIPIWTVQLISVYPVQMEVQQPVEELHHWINVVSVKLT